MRISGVLTALSLSGALVIGTQVPVQAAMFTARPAVAKAEGQAGQVEQVRFGGGFRGGGFRGGGFRGGWGGGGWRGGGWGWGVGGLAAGALIGAAIASPYGWGDPYYAYDGYPVGYADPYYGPYGYGPGPYWRRRVGYGPGWW